jgi:hypothetical protein
VAHQLVGERPRWALVFLEQRLVEVALAVELFPIELGRRETEPHDPFGLGEERREPALRTAVGHQRRERRDDGGAHEQAAVGLRDQERRVRPMGDFGEPRRQQAGEQAFDHLLPIGPDRALIAGRQQAEHADRRGGRFSIGGQRVERVRVRGHRVDRPRPWRRARWNGPEVGDDHRLDRRRVEVADGNHRHQIGAVPVAVETPSIGRD